MSNSCDSLNNDDFPLSVLERVIAMSFPSSGMRSLYRNPIKVSPHAYRIRELLKIDITHWVISSHVGKLPIYIQVDVPAFIVIATTIETGTT